MVVVRRNCQKLSDFLRSGSSTFFYSVKIDYVDSINLSFLVNTKRESR